MSCDRAMSLKITVELTDAPDDLILEAFARAKALVSMVDGLTPAAQAHAVVAPEAAPAEKPKARKTRAKRTPTPAAPAEPDVPDVPDVPDEPAPEDIPPAATAAEPEDTEPDTQNDWTEDSIRALCEQVLAAHGNKVIADTLKAYGVKKVSQLTPDIYGQFADTLREAVA